MRGLKEHAAAICNDRLLTKKPHHPLDDISLNFTLLIIVLISLVEIFKQVRDQRQLLISSPGSVFFLSQLNTSVGQLPAVWSFWLQSHWMWRPRGSVMLSVPTASVHLNRALQQLEAGCTDADSSLLFQWKCKQTNNSFCQFVINTECWWHIRL